MPTFTHRIKRSYRLSIYPKKPPLRKRPPKCHCWVKHYEICSAFISALNLPVRSVLPVSWVRINPRVGNRSLVDIIGGNVIEQDYDLLSALNVQPSQIEEACGIKAIERFAPISRSDARRLVRWIRMFLKVPCTNHLIEGRWIPREDRDPDDDDADWSHGEKEVLLRGELIHTTLPRLDCGLQYFISIYWIKETPDYPAKVEVIALAPRGVWFPESLKDMVQKAMSQFILGILQGAGIESQPLYGKMAGEPYEVKGRGLGMRPGAVRRAAALADRVCMDRYDYPILDRQKALIPSLLACVGKPLNQNAIAELLNGQEGKMAFHRTPRPFRYNYVPPTMIMARLRQVVSKRLRVPSEPTIPKPFRYRVSWVPPSVPFAYRYSWLAPDNPLAKMQLVITKQDRRE